MTGYVLGSSLKLTAKEIESTGAGCNSANVGPVLWLDIRVCVLVPGQSMSLFCMDVAWVL